jgi:hypothetical protein
MLYPDGTLAKLGDRVRLGNVEGTVIFSIDTDEYSPENPREQWGYLGSGVGIHFEAYGIIHYQSPEEDLKFVSRGSAD